MTGMGSPRNARRGRRSATPIGAPTSRATRKPATTGAAQNRRQPQALRASSRRSRRKGFIDSSGGSGTVNNGSGARRSAWLASRAPPSCTPVGATSSEAAEASPVVAAHHAKNRFLLRGNVTHRSWHEAFATLVSLNNETLNVYVCLLGLVPTLWFATADAHRGLDRWESSILTWAVGLFVGNLVLTITYHLMCTVPHLYHPASVLDLAGIGLGCASLILLGCALGHVPYPLRGLPFSYAVTVVLGYHVVVNVAVVVWRAYNARETPKLLLLLNVSGEVALTMQYVWDRTVHHLPVAEGEDSAWKPVLGHALLLGGCIVYGLRIPERWMPGVFDHVGHSHQIWHTAFVTAFLVLFSDAVAVFKRS